MSEIRMTSSIKMRIESKEECDGYENQVLVHVVDPKVIWLESGKMPLNLIGLLVKICSHMPNKPQLQKLGLVRTTFDHAAGCSPVVFLMQHAPLKNFALIECTLSSRVFQKICVGLRLAAPTLTELIVRDMDLVQHDPHLEMFCSTLQELQKLETLVLQNIGMRRPNARLVDNLAKIIMYLPQLRSVNISGNTFSRMELDDLVGALAVGKVQMFKLDWMDMNTTTAVNHILASRAAKNSIGLLQISV